jgi:hypothetical protein
MYAEKRGTREKSRKKQKKKTVLGRDGRFQNYNYMRTGADTNTLTLLVALLSSSHGSVINYLLLVGAYRDNEVNNEHPLSLALDEMKEKGGIVRQLKLSPLSEDHVVKLLDDSFNKNPSISLPILPFIPHFHVLFYAYNFFHFNVAFSFCVFFYYLLYLLHFSL